MKLKYCGIEYEGIQEMRPGETRHWPAEATCAAIVQDEDTLRIFLLEDEKRGVDTLTEYFQEAAPWAVPLKYVIVERKT